MRKFISYDLFIIFAIFFYGLGHPTISNSKVIEKDEREEMASYINRNDFVKYSSVGRIVCPIPGENDYWSTSGFVAGSFVTVATVSHAFYMPDDRPGYGGLYRYLNPATCHFTMYSNSGEVLDNIPISFANSRWDLTVKRGNRADDLSAVRLVRKPAHSFKALAIEDGSTLEGNAVSLCAHHNDLYAPNIPRLGRGYMRLMRPENGGLIRRFLTDVDTGSGASGGMYINPVSGQVIGIHGGYDEDSGKNYGILFDMAFVKLLHSAANAIN